MTTLYINQLFKPSSPICPSRQWSALNVCYLATIIVLDYAPSDFGPSTQIIRACDSTRREVMGTLEIELLIGPAIFVTLFHVLRIPRSFSLLLG